MMSIAIIVLAFIGAVAACAAFILYAMAREWRLDVFIAAYLGVTAVGAGVVVATARLLLGPA